MVKLTLLLLLSDSVNWSSSMAQNWVIDDKFCPLLSCWYCLNLIGFVVVVDVRPSSTERRMRCRRASSLTHNLAMLSLTWMIRRCSKGSMASLLKRTKIFVFFLNPRKIAKTLPRSHQELALFIKIVKHPFCPLKLVQHALKLVFNKLKTFLLKKGRKSWDGKKRKLRSKTQSIAKIDQSPAFQSVSRANTPLKNFWHEHPQVKIQEPPLAAMNYPWFIGFLKFCRTFE